MLTIKPGKLYKVKKATGIWPNGTYRVLEQDTIILLLEYSDNTDIISRICEYKMKMFWNGIIVYKTTGYKFEELFAET